MRFLACVGALLFSGALLSEAMSDNDVVILTFLSGMDRFALGHNQHGYMYQFIMNVSFSAALSVKS